MYYLFIFIIFFQSSVLAQDSIINTDSSNKTQDSNNQISQENLIHYGDLVEVDVIGSVEYDWRGTLTSEGFLDGIQFIDEPVSALCKSEVMVAEKIADSYSKFLREPKVVVRILDRSNRPHSIVSGAIKNPQRFQIKRPVHLNELLIIAGGLTDKASGEIQIFRPPNLSCLNDATNVKTPDLSNFESRERFVSASRDNGTQYLNIKISDLLNGKNEANPRILTGDIINVLEALPIYVIGGVAFPKQISSRSQMTVTRAIASAGGLTKGSDETKITIFRRINSETDILEVDLDKIKKGESEDIILKAYDIVDVPQKGKDNRKQPPILENFDLANNDRLKLPLRIID